MYYVCMSYMDFSGLLGFYSIFFQAPEILVEISFYILSSGKSKLSSLHWIGKGRAARLAVKGSRHNLRIVFMRLALAKSFRVGQAAPQKT